jgi:hypothetical protein
MPREWTVDALRTAFDALGPAEQDAFLLAAIKSLPPARQRLLGVDVLVDPEGVFRQAISRADQVWEAQGTLLQLVQNHLKGPRVKAQRTAERHRVIDSLREQGYTTDEAILEHLKQQHPDLVRRKKGKNDWIDAGLMMKQYRKDRGET